MKDVHNHILFGVDDGSKDLEESLKIIEKAVNNGYTDLILTPHYRQVQDYTCDNRRKRKIFKALQRAVKENELKIRLYLGNEITIDNNFFYYLEEDNLLTLNDSRYILLELPFAERIDNVESIFEKLIGMGYVPIIAHPERYELYYNFEELEKWIKMGVLFQGNLGSLYGKYGTKAKKQIEELLQRRMIHFMGSDVHHAEQSSYVRIRNAFEKIENLTGSKEIALDLVDRNIQKVIKNEEIEHYKIRKKKKRLKLLKIFNK